MKNKLIIIIVVLNVFLIGAILLLVKFDILSVTFKSDGDSMKTEQVIIGDDNFDNNPDPFPSTKIIDDIIESSTGAVNKTVSQEVALLEKKCISSGCDVGQKYIEYNVLYGIANDEYDFIETDISNWILLENNQDVSCDEIFSGNEREDVAIRNFCMFYRDNSNLKYYNTLKENKNADGVDKLLSAADCLLGNSGCEASGEGFLNKIKLYNLGNTQMVKEKYASYNLEDLDPSVKEEFEVISLLLLHNIVSYNDLKNYFKNYIYDSFDK